MKHSHILFVATLVALAGCAGTTDNRSQNRLLRIQRAEELADTLANIIIEQDPITKDPATMEMITKEIARAKQALAAEQSAQSTAMSGPFLSMQESVQGWALMQDGALHLSSDFHSRPGIDLRIYLTTAVDPRDVTFPDVSAVDLGSIDYPYGPLILQIPSGSATEKLRTAVVWDARLKRLHGFAQLSVRQ